MSWNIFKRDHREVSKLSDCWKKVQFATNDESRVIGFQFARCPIDSSFGTIAKHWVAVAIKIRTPPPPPSPPSAPSSPRFRRLWFVGEGASGTGTGAAGGWWMRPPDQCSGGSGHDARRSRRGASRRWRAGSPRDAKRECAKRSPLPVYSCGIPTRAAPFPGIIVRILMPSAPCRYPRRGQKHPRTTVELCAFELTRWERKRGRGGGGGEGRDREWSVYLGELTIPGTIRTCDSPSGVLRFYFNRNLGNVCRRV